MKSVLYSALALFVLLTGCVIDPKNVEEDFGKSVKQMVDAQIYDPKAATNPDLIAPLILDGSAAGSSVETVREKSKGKGDEKKQPLTINVN